MTLDTIGSRRVGAACLVAASFSLAACQAGGERAPEPTNNTVVSPLAAIYTVLQGGAVDDDSVRQQQQAIADSVAACMKTEGLDLLDSYGQGAAQSGDTVDFDPSSRESVAQYGYGLTTIPAPVAMEDEFPSDWSEGDREAYRRVLYGEPEDPGCETQAIDDQFADANNLQNDEAYAALLTEFQNLWPKVDADPAMVDLNARWSDCMADEQFPDLAVQGDAGAMVFDHLTGKSASDTVEYRGAQSSASAFEVRVALADFDCREAVEYDKTFMDVRLRFEAELAELYADEIQELLLEYGG